jgi:hypothetical protein
MTTAKARSLLAFAVVGVFMGTTGFMAVFPLVTKVSVDLKEYADFFAKTASVYTGIVGVVVGYYFGRATEDAVSSATNAPASANKPPDVR